MDHELVEINQRIRHFNASSTNSETAIAIADSNGLELNKAAVTEDQNTETEGEDKLRACVIDIDGEDLARGNQRVCRICHLSAKESGMISLTEVMELGCGCKGELGVAHSHCAEAWFKVRGNRLCEICGETAKNITGVGGNAFMEEWNDQRRSGDSGISSPDDSRGCLRGQPLCNLLMACLVIAFVLPWFLRVNMF
ncbi:hypothetical protein BUALT_Bualt18G0118100 [Buddleja alternifolia]|uniref:RING-CH-type domain-containing protein n=1 Tax=Buddleja alternifolia TaxID=168488 RepID=A0AAV6W4V6_9LAMI|nr:hypothetical protein BUALT_Bualt18G0118100 [Buddleja alternifolia]